MFLGAAWRLHETPFNQNTRYTVFKLGWGRLTLTYLLDFQRTVLISVWRRHPGRHIAPFVVDAADRLLCRFLSFSARCSTIINAPFNCFADDHRCCVHDRAAQYASNRLIVGPRFRQRDCRTPTSHHLARDLLPASRSPSGQEGAPPLRLTMLRFRRYRVFLILAIFSVFVLYHFTTVQNWQDARVAGVEKLKHLGLKQTMSVPTPTPMPVASSPPDADEIKVRHAHGPGDRGLLTSI